MKLGALGVSAAAAILIMESSCGFQVHQCVGRMTVGRSSCQKHSNRWNTAPSAKRRVARSPVMCAPQASDVASASPKPKKAPRGHGGMGKMDPNSFVQGDMRKAAMRLHTRDQAPKEGEKQNKGKKFSEWVPSRRGYLQFLVDSREVYHALEEACESTPALEPFRGTGLERTAALDKDIAWMLQTFPEELGGPGGEGGGVGGLEEGGRPEPTSAGKDYASFLRETVGSSIPAFMCHFYNHYFAHTAGGLMIGKMVADRCLDGRTLEFYKWEKWGGDVKALLDEVRKSIDTMAGGWTEEEKEACLGETANSFKYGGALVASIRD